MSQEPLDRWLGNQERCSDALDPALAARIAATLGHDCPAPGEALPPLWHWAFFQNPVTADGLGTDGHPARGGFLPPADDRNRMWAGGHVEFLAPLRVGMAAERISTVADIQQKQGRTGALLFVTVRHDYRQADELVIRERQEIVYRQPAPPKRELDEPMPDAEWSRSVTPTPTLLFRYSAVTFNGHRIHYDWPYATETEGYADLVVHGPLIATLQLETFCAAHPEARVTEFTYRGLRPLTAERAFETTGRLVSPGRAELTAGNEFGPAHRASVSFDIDHGEEAS